MDNTITIIKKIVENNSITLDELNKFITEYVEKTKNKVVTTTELEQIRHMIQNGLFNLVYAAKEYARLLKYQVLQVVEINTGRILKTELYEL